MARSVLVTYELIGAWESWNVSVPDDAPTDPAQLLVWINHSPTLVEWEGIEDSGNGGMTAVNTEETAEGTDPSQGVVASSNERLLEASLNRAKLRHPHSKGKYN